MISVNGTPKEHPNLSAQIPDAALRMLKDCGLFAGISDDEFKAMLSVLNPTLRHYNRDKVIIDEGDAADIIGIVVSGRVAVGKMTSGGRIHIFAVHEAGEAFGIEAVFSTYRTSPLTFTADTDCTVLLVSTDCLARGFSTR